LVRVEAGACGFVTRITAKKVDRRHVRIEMESDCEAVQAIAARLKEMGSLGLRDILGKGLEKNTVLAECSELLSHAGCPVPGAIIKVSEVELGLNVPKRVVIEFELEPEDPESAY